MVGLPNYTVPTGDYVQEWMDNNGVNAADMARRLGVSPKHVSELLKAKVALTPEMADLLERVTGVPSAYWNRMEAGYRKDLIRLAAEAELTRQYPAIIAYPILYLRQLGFVTAETYDKPGIVEEVFRFFRVVDADALEATWCQGVAFRKTAAANPKKEALLTWLTVAERGVDFASLAPFDKSALRELLPELRTMSRDEPKIYIQAMIARLAGVGVALCLVPEVPGLGIHGATRWIDGHPVIQLSLRGKTDDQLWFTLFHELGHVLMHDTRSLYLAGSDDEREAEADQFASDTLIPPEVITQLPRGRNLEAVRQLAAEIGVSPGVVLGRVQRETGDYGWGHQLKKHFQFSYPMAAKGKAA